MPPSAPPPDVAAPATLPPSRGIAPSEPPGAPPPITLPPGATAQGLAERQAAMLRDIEAINRVRILMGDTTAEDASHATLTTPRPSMAAKAAKKTAVATWIGMAVLGMAASAAEWVASRYADQLGPIGALLEVGLRLLRVDGS